MFYNNKHKECHTALQAALDLSTNLFHNKPEAIFQYKRNLLAFYTHTDIESASKLVDSFLANKNSTYYRYFIYAGSSIKLINQEYTQSKELLETSLNLGLTPIYEGNVLNNLAIMKIQLINDIKYSVRLMYNKLAKSRKQSSSKWYFQ